MAVTGSSFFHAQWCAWPNGVTIMQEEGFYWGRAGQVMPSLDYTIVIYANVVGIVMVAVTRMILLLANCRWILEWLRVWELL